jgi:hypothetical protein
MVRLNLASRVVTPVVIGLMIGGCGPPGPDHEESAPRYVVTASPIDLRIGSGLCVAVDPSDPQGVWWWQPGKDCSSRSTGPMVFQGQEAAVVRSDRSETIDIRFRIPVHRRLKSSEPPFVDVSLRLEAGQLRAEAAGSQVATVTRHDLDIPEAWRDK